MRRFLLPIAVAALLGKGAAQNISTVSTRWDDSFVEWEIFSAALPAESEEKAPPEEELYGELRLRWLNFKDDFSEWTYELGGQRGTIRQKWKNDPTQWELRTYEGDVVTLKTAWANDPFEWRVTDNSIALTIKSRWTNQLDEWICDDPNRGRFYLYTLQTGDPRDWAVEDKMTDEVSEPMKMAMIFIAIFQSAPKE